MTSPTRSRAPRAPRHLVFACLLAILPALLGASFSTRVVGVTDGDTVTILRERDGHPRETKLRLYGIDAPERRQPFGKRARQALADLVLQHSVEVDSVNTDRYGRTVGRLHVDGRYVNLEMVQTGFAWHFRRYSADLDLAGAELEAREAKRGLWTDPHAIPPWEFRHRHDRGPSDLAGKP